MIRRRLKRRKKLSDEDPDPAFQVAPMADLLLVLVVFFMSITSAEFFHANRLIHLAEAAQGKQRPERVDQVIINVGWVTGLRSGTIQVGDRTLSKPEDLMPILKEHLQAVPNLRVLIRADKNVEYRYISAILKACRQVKIPNVVFSVLGRVDASQNK